MLIFLLACGPVADGGSGPDPATCEVATPADIRERTGDYYRCLDTTLVGGAGCGAEGSPLGFGARYADQSFDVTWYELGKAGQAFFLAVSPCLQERLAERVTAGATCEEVWEAGFGTHADCYVESGFCELPVEDLAVIAGMFDAETVALPEFQAAIGEVTARCAKGGW